MTLTFGMMKNKRKIFVRAFCLWVMLSFFFISSAFAKPIYEFEVPVILKNLPKEVKYVVVEWGVGTEFLEPLFTGRKEFNMQAVPDGNFSTVIKITVKDTDIKDFTKAHRFYAYLKLSEDGFAFFDPNTPGLPWTKSKPGATIRSETFSDILS